MKVTPTIKEFINNAIQDGITDASAIQTDLVEFGIVDEEFELYDENGEFDFEKDRLVQECVAQEIHRQLELTINQDLGCEI